MLEAPPQVTAAFKFMTDIEVEGMQPLPWLIEDILPASSLSILCGDAGTGKSFLALDWALCIATGHSWQGREVQKGPVVYIAAEGIAGLGKRIRAWKQEIIKDPGLRAEINFVGSSIQLLDDGAVSFVRAIIGSLKEPPVLIIIDTLARCMVGGEENMGQYMGKVIQNCDWMKVTIAEKYAEQGKDAISPHIMFVHHTPKGGKGPRGHSSLRGAADVVIEVTKPRKPHGSREGEKRMRITCDKQKDADVFEPFSLVLKKVSLKNNDQSEDSLTSCVLVSGE